METIKLGWKEYIQQPVLPASLAYVLLYFNIVLTPGSLMTAFLTQRCTLLQLGPLLFFSAWMKTVINKSESICAITYYSYKLVTKLSFFNRCESISYWWFQWIMRCYGRRRNLLISKLGQTSWHFKGEMFSRHLLS